MCVGAIPTRGHRMCPQWGRSLCLPATICGPVVRSIEYRVARGHAGDSETRLRGGEHRGSVARGLVSLVKEFEFHPNSNEEPLWPFSQRNDMMLFAFLENPFGCREKAKSGIEGGGELGLVLLPVFSPPVALWGV